MKSNMTTIVTILQFRSINELVTKVDSILSQRYGCDISNKLWINLT